MRIESQKLIERYEKTHQILCPDCVNFGSCSCEDTDEDILTAIWCTDFETDNEELKNRIKIKKNGCKWISKVKQ
jgi:hypothetical protein